MSTAGSIESVSLDGRLFAVAADADSNRKIGGFENEVQSNGNGTNRVIKKRVPSMIDGLTIDVDDDLGDQEFVQQLADSGVFFPTVVTYAGGVSFQGSMQLTGELQKGSQNGTMPIKLEGGVLTKQ